VGPSAARGVRRWNHALPPTMIGFVLQGRAVAIPKSSEMKSGTVYQGFVIWS
jgi:hypothetical protein